MTADLKFYALQKTGGHMKALAATIILMTLSGCNNGEFIPKGYGHELAYKCDLNPYDPDCLQPPPIFNGP